MRRLTCMTAAALVALVALAPAAAGTSISRYRGTGGSMKIEFHVYNNALRVLVVRHVPVTCSNGASFFYRDAALGKATIRKGKLDMVVGDINTIGVEYSVIGRIKGKRASGTLKYMSRVGIEGPDPNGEVQCSSPKVRWTAKRYFHFP